jgi:hypothetical protein
MQIVVAAVADFVLPEWTLSCDPTADCILPFFTELPNDLWKGKSISDNRIAQPPVDLHCSVMPTGDASHQHDALNRSFEIRNCIKLTVKR